MIKIIFFGLAEKEIYLLKSLIDNLYIASPNKIYYEIFNDSFSFIEQMKADYFSLVFSNITETTKSAFFKREVNRHFIVLINKKNDFRYINIQDNKSLYILNTINTETLYILIKCYSAISMRLDSKICFKTIQGPLAIYFDEIINFEYIDRKVKLITLSSSYFINDTLIHIYQELNDSRFAIPHRSFIVNIQKIEHISIRSKTITMNNKCTIPISQTSFKFFKDLYTQFYDTNSKKFV